MKPPVCSGSAVIRSAVHRISGSAITGASERARTPRQSRRSAASRNGTRAASGQSSTACERASGASPSASAATTAWCARRSVRHANIRSIPSTPSAIAGTSGMLVEVSTSTPGAVATNSPAKPAYERGQSDPQPERHRGDHRHCAQRPPRQMRHPFGAAREQRRDEQVAAERPVREQLAHPLRVLAPGIEEGGRRERLDERVLGDAQEQRVVDRERLVVKRRERENHGQQGGP